MPRNPILEDLCAAREELLADGGGDAEKYLEGVRERASGHQDACCPQTIKEQSDATERRSLAIWPSKIFRRRPLIGRVIWLEVSC